MIAAILQQPGAQVYPEFPTSPFDVFRRFSSDDCARFIVGQKPEKFAERDCTGYLLIHHACLKGDALVVAALLHIGCDPSAKTTSNVSASHLAAMRGHVVILSLLAEAGANLEETDSQMRTPLHYAALHDQTIAVSWIIKVCKLKWITSVDAAGRTALHLACEAGHDRTVRVLLSAARSSDSFDVVQALRTRDHSGNTSLHSALTSAPSATASYAPSSPKTLTTRACKVIWLLLTSTNSDWTSSCHNQKPDALSTIEMQNYANETPLDLATNHCVGFRLYALLFLAHSFNKHFSSRYSFPLFTLFYFLIWLGHFLLPFMIILLTVLLANWTRLNWLYLIGAVLALGSSVKQKHRLDDATERPNPYFLGALLTGLVFSIHSLWYDLSIPVNDKITIYPSLVVIILCPVLCYLLYTLVFWQHTSLSPREADKNTLLQLVSNDVAAVCDRLSRILTQSDLTPAPAPIPYAEVYCALCDVHLSRIPAVPVKHCRLCNRCRADLDHHCLFIMNCVTGVNLRRFVLLLLCILCFMCSFIAVAISIPMHVCTVADNQDPSSVFAWLHCMFERFHRPLLLVPFHIFTGLWTLMLFNEHCYRLGKSPTSHASGPWKRRQSFSGGLRFAMRTLQILICGRHNSDRLRSTVLPDL